MYYIFQMHDCFGASGQVIIDKHFVPCDIQSNRSPKNYFRCGVSVFLKIMSSLP